MNYNFDKMIADFSKEIQLDPNNVPAYMKRASVYAMMTDYDQAITDFEAVLRINPNQAEAKQGIQVCKAEKTKATPPIFTAVAAGDIELVKRIVSGGADVNVKTKNGYTPLHCAVHEGNIEIIKFLISHGADVNVKDEDGDTPLDLAAHENNNEIAKLLISGGKTISTYETIFDAARGGTVEDLRYFLEEKKADVNAKEFAGFTPLHLAVMHENVELVRFLVSEGKANVDAENDDGSTPLHNLVRKMERSAIKSEDTEIIKFLVSKGKANINAKEDDGTTALHIAASSGNIELAKVLLSLGADINVRNNNGRTPQDIADTTKNTAMIQCLSNKEELPPLGTENMESQKVRNKSIVSLFIRFAPPPVAIILAGISFASILGASIAISITAIAIVLIPSFAILHFVESGEEAIRFELFRTILRGCSTVVIGGIALSLLPNLLFNRVGIIDGITFIVIVIALIMAYKKPWRNRS